MASGTYIRPSEPHPDEWKARVLLRSLRPEATSVLIGPNRDKAAPHVIAACEGERSTGIWSHQGTHERQIGQGSL